MSEEGNEGNEGWSCFGGTCIRGGIEESTKLYDEALKRGIII